MQGHLGRCEDDSLENQFFDVYQNQGVPGTQIMLDGRLVCHIVRMLQGHVQEHQLSMYNIITKVPL
jgi:hypothetical protein